MHFVYLLLGSNLGDSKTVLKSALLLIEEEIGKIVKLSASYRTAPWGVTDQPDYLNQVAKVETALSAHDTLRGVLEIEKWLGRIRKEKWEARIIDIDILYFDNCIINEPDLKIPHPLLHLRKFVLVPLNEIAPDFVHPGFNTSNSHLLAQLDDRSSVERKEEN